MASQRLITILILFLAGCERPASTVRQTSPAASFASQTTGQVIEPTTTPASEQANEITGKVIGIIDGDTIDILTSEKTTIRIRLKGIDAPETGQPFGKNAKQYLSEFIGGQMVRVVTHGEDRYGRTIGDVFFNSVEGADIPPGATLPDWEINRELVQNGLAWHFKKYSTDINLEMDEATARDRKLGLWSDPRHVAPWEWRALSKDERDELR